MEEREQTRASAPFDVEAALNEVANAIEEGARPMTTAHVRDGFKARYREDFTFLSNNGVPYAPSRDHLLALARAVGALARALTLAEAVASGTTLPENAPVDAESAYLAGFLVARISPQITARARAATRMGSGHFCRNYYLVTKVGAAPPEAERGAAAVLSFFAHLESAA
jgi:hypothetical protein